jgi:uncharacterized repeat protein (TIGR03803 family)
MINRLHGMTVVAVLVLAALAQAQTFHSIFSFDGRDGAIPYTGRLAIDRTTGTMYGTTVFGGDLNCGGGYGCGVVFKLDTAGNETVLHRFTDRPDGALPGPVIRDSKGNLYGTAESGGSSSVGVVFKIDSAGKETVLYSFTGGSDGCYPLQGLVRDKAGNLYGTTTACLSSHLYGAIFKIDTAGKETTLHSFAGGSSDGASPDVGSMVMDKKGNLYGMTLSGGGPSNCGTLYKYSKSGKFRLLYSFAGDPNNICSSLGTLYKYSRSGEVRLLHSFAGSAWDGCRPLGTPALDGKGNLNGVTFACGRKQSGTVWKVSSSGTETILHNFTQSDPQPSAGVALDNKGNLYGLTEYGGAFGWGTLYELSSGGRFTTLHSFDYSDGGNPAADEVLIDKKGTLYGAATQGGSNGSGGTVWTYVP